MSEVKQYFVSPMYKKASASALRKNMPSDMLFTMASAIYDRSKKSKTYAERAFYRTTVNKIMALVKSIRNLEA